jgi:serine protease Do
MMTKRELWRTILVASLVSMLTTGLWNWYADKKTNAKAIQLVVEENSKQPTIVARDAQGNPISLDFTTTSEKVMDAVVHIRSTRAGRAGAGNDPFGESQDLFEYFFGPRGRRQNPGQGAPSVGEGSGVIVSADGYVVTNNHVIENADEIEVTLHDNRKFKAQLLGVDPNTDLAVLKIAANNLVFLSFSDSDKVRVGEWVLAVGNPFNLNSTVTAGIVSAKGRNINILQEQYAVESFIQTDAAINPGNSGGALVNLNGALIGINTAIASPTGAYSGYGFAVPSNIVRKVVDDLIQMGAVQRGFLGITIRTVDANLAKTKDLSVVKGVFVDSIMPGSAAGKSGLKIGDVIVAIDGKAVASSPELQEQIARRRPGDMLTLKVNRKGDVREFKVTLLNKNGKAQSAMADSGDSLLDQLGIEVENVSPATLRRLEIAGGVKVVAISNGKIRTQTQMREGFIIARVNGEMVKNKTDFLKVMEGKKGGVMLEGRYEEFPGEYYYAFGL